MVEAGMTGIRMNLSHGPLAAHTDWLAMIRAAGIRQLLIDLQGPELRIGRLPQPLSLTAGQTCVWARRASPALPRWCRVCSPGRSCCWMTASCWLVWTPQSRMRSCAP